MRVFLYVQGLTGNGHVVRTGQIGRALADRTEPAETLLQTARIYCEERYGGNLFELIFRRGKKFHAAVASTHPEALRLTVPIEIDNQVLNKLGFGEKI